MRAAGPGGRGTRVGPPAGGGGVNDELILVRRARPGAARPGAREHPELILKAANSEPPGLREAEGGAQHPATQSEGRPHARDCG